MNHFEGLKNSILVDNDSVSNYRVLNVHGHSWARITQLVIGSTDLRARIGNFSTPWGATPDALYRAPDLKYVNYDLFDLIDKRALDIFEISKKVNKKIALMWSGGIDSTLVLTSFLKNLSAADLSNVEIILNSDSLVENFDFYQTFISGKFKLHHLLDFEINNDILDRYMVLHGDPGDCIFGPSLPAFWHLAREGKHTLPWREYRHFIADYFDNDESIHRTPGFGLWYANKISKNLEEVRPDGIDTIADWWWWNYFNFKWTASIVRPFVRMRKDYSQPISRKHQQDFANYTFFNTDEFQLWSYSNLKNHFRDVQKGSSNVKQEAKNYIFKFDHNELYTSKKTKMAGRGIDFERRILRVSPMYYDQEWIGHFGWESGATETAQEMLESFKG
jgi:hypothetical protein